MTCPSCGGVLATVTDLVGETMAAAFHIVGVTKPRYRLRISTFYACSACEYCAEVHRVPKGTAV